ATVMSIFGLFQNFAAIIYNSVFALLCNVYAMRVCYIIISAYCITGTIMLYFISKVYIRERIFKTH
ncbi:MAG: hypothetical protein FWF08_10405, partial [Oscillospiraceae bacterium]|nr:hypothetical protein [Oscillospiraceae bacterium]